MDIKYIGECNVFGKKRLIGQYSNGNCSFFSVDELNPSSSLYNSLDKILFSFKDGISNIKFYKKLIWI